MIRPLLIALAVAACSSSPRREPDTTPPSDPAATATPSPAEGTPAQMPGSGADPCPTVQIKGPDSVAAGTQAKISTTLIGGPAAPTFRWTVTAGKIVSGQGTSSIVVDSTGLSGASVVAKVELGGLASQCATTGTSVTVLVGP
ncbi:MAG: hypothetical protein ABI175_15645 [Polyangiales bacterium]